MRAWRSGEEMTMMPLPLKPTVCGLPEALLLMVRVPVRAPMTVGLNVTSIVQLVSAARVAGLIGQFVVRAKSPLVAMLAIGNGAVLVFDSVTVCPGLASQPAGPEMSGSWVKHSPWAEVLCL